MIRITLTDAFDSSLYKFTLFILDFSGIFPLLYIHETRPEKVKVSYTLYDGKTEVEGWLEGMDSRCFQHEFEHLQGKLFLDNVSELKLQRAMKKRDKYLKEIQRKVKI